LPSKAPELRSSYDIHPLVPDSIGQFNMLSIQLSFGCLTYPALVLAYLGQGSRLIVDGENVLSNVFYQTIPGQQNGPLFWYTFLMARAENII